jgi:hypothetical protein
MSVDSLYDPVQGKAVMIDTTTDVAFGPLFESKEDVEDFLNWVLETYGIDVREWGDAQLASRFASWSDRKQEAEDEQRKVDQQIADAEDRAVDFGASYRGYV